MSTQNVLLLTVHELLHQWTSGLWNLASSRVTYIVLYRFAICDLYCLFFTGFAFMFLCYILSILWMLQDWQGKRIGFYILYWPVDDQTTNIGLHYGCPLITALYVFINSTTTGNYDIHSLTHSAVLCRYVQRIQSVAIGMRLLFKKGIVKKQQNNKRMTSAWRR